ncbi:hypothetical protein J6590_087999 [Homalodisca vitripennis]|nr:hypothetical protein J6590_087999 [Homalodisca vitripennis]
MLEGYIRPSTGEPEEFECLRRYCCGNRRIVGSTGRFSAVLDNSCGRIQHRGNRKQIGLKQKRHGFKLADLKVADLKRELEERDLDTSGTKTVLANRLKQAMIEAGEDPEILIFETEASKLTKVLQSNLTKTLEEKLNSNSKTLEEKLNSNSKTLEEKLNSNCETLQNDLKSMKDELATEFNLKICRVEEKFKKQLEAGINGCSKQLEDKLNDYSKEFGDRIRILEEIAQRNKGSETCTESIVSPEDGKPELITEPQLNSCPPMSNAGVPTFDGKMTWEDFRTLFETAAAVHRGPSSTKASMLCLSLRGDALKVLQTVPPAERQKNLRRTG